MKPTSSGPRPSRPLPIAPAVAVALLATSVASASPSDCYGVMFRTGSQTSGLGPWLFDVDPATGTSTNGRQMNVNNCCGIAIDPSTGFMYGLTDQFGRINNQSGSGGKNLIFKIDPPTGFCTAVGQLDPSDTSSSGPLSTYEGDLAFHPETGVLWGVTTRVNFARLFTVDTATGRGTIVADVLPATGTTLDLSAIAFDADGQLWALDTRYPTEPGPAKVYRIDSATGAVQQAWTTSVTLGTVAGMRFDPASGSLLVADGDTGGTANLYRFSAKAGDLVLVGATGVQIGNSKGFAGLEFTPPAPCPGDVDQNGAIDGADLASLLVAWGSAVAGTDLDGDGSVGAADLAILLASWGACP